MLTSLFPRRIRVLWTQPFQACRSYASKKKGGKDDGNAMSKEDASKEMASMLAKSSLAFKTVLERTKTEFGNVRVGRAHAGLLDSVYVSHNNSRLPLKEISQISSKDASTLKVNIHDEQLMRFAEKAVRDANMGFNPQRDTPTSFLVPIPRLSKEYRETMLKSVAMIAEKAKARIREIRAEAKGDVKKKLKQKATADEIRALEAKRCSNFEKLQVETNSAITEIDKTLDAKKREISD
ncbi:hypothetical protein HDU67_009130 [Dinochytrium kinnereticum]|nr:hypothetical protein HDU67_009130 [Dinochytrium kinnereticum]